MLVCGNNGIRGTFDQTRQIPFCFLKLVVGNKRALFRLFAVRNICPCSDKLLRMTRGVVNYLERILDPDIVTVPVTEAVCDCSASLLYQRWQFLENPRGIVVMKTGRPAFRVGRHFLRCETHNRLDVVTDKGTSEISRCLSGVNDRRADGKQILESLTRAGQFSFDSHSLCL